MDVIALVGPSGTGKSHRALTVAKTHSADAIIDDGILIKDGKIIAGESAKEEKSKIMAVRRAIFILPGHAESVKKAIAEVKPRRILVLGTSENMVHKIAKTLEIPQISTIIRIEDIASKDEIAKAQFYRLKQGKHVVPVPTIELKPHFSRLLIDPLQSLFKHTSTKRRRLGEKSIVRPVFSYYGKLIIDDSAVAAIVKNTVKKESFIKKISSLKVHRIMRGREGSGIDIHLGVALSYSKDHIPTLIKDTQTKIQSAVEFMTGLMVHEVSVDVKSLLV